MIRPQQAPVTPHVLSPETGEIVPLNEGFVSDERRAGGAIEIVGGPGAGKTTAVEHLAATEQAAEGVAFLDEPDPAHVQAAADDDLVVFTSRRPRSGLARRSFLLASWNDDDLIEYLLAVHPAECRSVMSRLRRAHNSNSLQGVPALWRVAVDVMAQDSSVIDGRRASALGRSPDRRVSRTHRGPRPRGRRVAAAARAIGQPLVRLPGRLCHRRLYAWMHTPRRAGRPGAAAKANTPL